MSRLDRDTSDEPLLCEPNPLRPGHRDDPLCFTWRVRAGRRRFHARRHSPRLASSRARFLENASNFTTPIQLLFTRRIADPLVGARASGRTGRYTLGSMVVDDRSPSDGGASDAKAWFGVARVTRDVGRESYVGLFLSDRGIGAGRNTIAAADGRIRLGANWFGVAQAAFSDTTSPTLSDARGSATSASLVGSGRHFNYELDYNDRSPAFKVVDGFIPRVDIRSIDQTYSYRVRPSDGALKAWGPDLVVNRVWEYSGHPLDWAATPRLSFEWPGATTREISTMTPY